METRILAGVIGAVLVVGMPEAWACGSDNECKGDRICDNQICVSPKQTAPAAGVCRADVDCPADNLCTGGVCTPAPATPPVVHQPVELIPPSPVWQYNSAAPAPRPFTHPVLVMRNPRLRNAGVALVTIGVVMEVVGIGLSVGGCQTAVAPSRYAYQSEAYACQNNAVASDLLVGLGLPILANGAWMWPVGGKLVPEHPSTFAVVPYAAVHADGGAFGMKLTFF